LSILPGGWVVVGSLPTTKDGALPHLSPIGCLIVLNSTGTAVATWANANIDGPWDMTAQSTATGASLFVSNVLAGSGPPNSAPAKSGTCTIVRIDVALANGTAPKMTAATVVGSGFPWKLNPATVVLGPTGVAMSAGGTLFAANTLTNTITAIPQALTRTTAVQYGTGTITQGGGLNEPLGLIMVSNGDLVAVNGNDGNAVEITTAGKQVATVTLAHNGAGVLFGIAQTQDGQGLLFVNDGTNSLDLFSG
jgi:hypothetical protein